MTEAPQQPAPESPEKPDAPQGDAPQEPQGDERTFTQKDVNKMMGDVRQDATNNLLSQLGLESVDDLKSVVQTHNEQVEAQKTEAQKAQEAAQQHQQRVQELEQELAARDYEQQVGGAMRKHGLVDDYSDDALLAFDVYATANDLYDKDGNLEDPEAAVQQFAEAKPIYFGASGGSSAPDMNSGGSSGGSDASLDAFEQRLRQQGLAAG